MHAPSFTAPPPGPVKVRRALISVSDKTGIVDFARALASMGVTIISTGGTAKALDAAGIRCTPIEEITGLPEMMDGRVKTLHPAVHGALLAVRDHPEHAAALKRHRIEPIDLVCINLYPFEQTVAKPGVSRAEAIENIDIGGPSMIRSAAKNHAYVAVVTSPDQYEAVLDDLRSGDGCTSPALRDALAHAAFIRTARYDAAISNYLGHSPPPRGRGQGVGFEGQQPSESMSNSTTRGNVYRGSQAHVNPPPAPSLGEGEKSHPARLTLSYARSQLLRYGENPHQSAAVYRDDAFTGPSVVRAAQLHGKDLGYNNVADAAAALDLAWALAEHDRWTQVGAAIIKHANPCGAAVAFTAREAIDAALAGDPTAAFGGILACSHPIDADAAARLTGKDTFLEVIIAPSFAEDALAMLKAKSVNVRLLATGNLRGQPVDRRMVRSIPGGLLVQERDLLAPDTTSWKHVAGPTPSDATLHAAAITELFVRAMSSNAIAIGGVFLPLPEGGGQGVGFAVTKTLTNQSPPPAPSLGEGVRLLGGGVGQVDRVTACRLAVEKAKQFAPGLLAAGSAIAVSDAFFPFPDGPRILIDAGVKTIVHPGGSKRDQETFDLCATHNVTCLVTGVRRFRH